MNSIVKPEYWREVNLKSVTRRGVYSAQKAVVTRDEFSTNQPEIVGSSKTLPSFTADRQKNGNGSWVKARLVNLHFCTVNGLKWPERKITRYVR